MPLTVIPGADAPHLRDLRMVDQLFLWTVRHLVCASEDARPMPARIDQFYRDAGLPRVVGLTVALMRSICAAATQSFVVNVPCGVQVLPDERSLLTDLHRCIDQPRSLSALKTKVSTCGGHTVAARLHDLACQFAALDAMRESRPAAPLARIH